ncbi:UNVERIFIED_CONTAM: hypothetical protein RMT77_016066 [Armadillidium vulgare]
MIGDEEFVKNLNKESLSTTDILGRNCFYYAVQHNRFSILNDLMNKDAELKFEPFLVNNLRRFIIRREGTFPHHTKFLEFILEKENKNGYFAREYLDQCLSLTFEIIHKQYEIAAILITKFNKKIPKPSSHSSTKL